LKITPITVSFEAQGDQFTPAAVCFCPQALCFSFEFITAMLSASIFIIQIPP